MSAILSLSLSFSLSLSLSFSSSLSLSLSFSPSLSPLSLFQTEKYFYPCSYGEKHFWLFVAFSHRRREKFHDSLPQHFFLISDKIFPDGVQQYFFLLTVVSRQKKGYFFISWSENQLSSVAFYDQGTQKLKIQTSSAKKIATRTICQVEK